jgi:hypothetical protein
VKTICQWVAIWPFSAALCREKLRYNSGLSRSGFSTDTVSPAKFMALVMPCGNFMSRIPQFSCNQTVLWKLRTAYASWTASRSRFAFLFLHIAYDRFCHHGIYRADFPATARPADRPSDTPTTHQLATQPPSNRPKLGNIPYRVLFDVIANF